MKLTKLLVFAVIGLANAGVPSSVEQLEKEVVALTKKKANLMKVTAITGSLAGISGLMVLSGVIKAI
jgi:hypothetical protein